VVEADVPPHRSQLCLLFCGGRHCVRVDLIQRAAGGRKAVHGKVQQRLRHVWADIRTRNTECLLQCRLCIRIVLEGPRQLCSSKIEPSNSLQHEPFPRPLGSSSTRVLQSLIEPGERIIIIACDAGPAEALPGCLSDRFLFGNDLDAENGGDRRRCHKPNAEQAAPALVSH
jgi:hypothetical protein